MKYLVEGRVIPERVDFNSPTIGTSFTLENDVTVDVTLYIIKSKIFVHIDSKTEVQVPTLRNFLFEFVGDVINFAGFQHVLGISYELDSITNIDEGSTWLFGVDGFVFDDTTQLGNTLTFKANEFGKPYLLTPELLSNSYILRATFELRNSIRYPHFTALHCRLAIEAIRNAFDSKNENNGWKQLREILSVSRETIESFKDVATEQRHGRNLYQTWQQRRHCMQVAWEIVHRFIRHTHEKPEARLDLPLL
jgi:hypothetical protein